MRKGLCRQRPPCDAQGAEQTPRRALGLRPWRTWASCWDLQPWWLCGDLVARAGGWFMAWFILVCLLFSCWRMSNRDCAFLPTTWKEENWGNSSKDVLADEFWLIRFRGWWRQRFNTSKYTLAAPRLFLHAFHSQNSPLFSPKCGTLPTPGIKHPHLGDPDEMCPLAAKPGESILPSPQPCSAEGAAPARFGIPVGSGCFSCSHLWGVDVLALRKNSEVSKKKNPNQTKKRCWGDYFLKSPVDKTGWNNFCE